MNLPKIKIPLILGIWGGKGQGKTFQVDLVYRKLGVSSIVMSAGELESGNAGEPAKLVRQRYREASDIVKKGKMASLFINDLARALPRARPSPPPRGSAAACGSTAAMTRERHCRLQDAGAGRMGGTTQYTVNNQMVNATLMNIADNPTNVQLPGVYQTARASQPLLHFGLAQSGSSFRELPG